MKTITKKTLFIALTSTALAVTPFLSANAQQTSFDGSYIGGAVALNKSKTGASITPAVTTTLESKDKVGGGIYAGYGTQMEQLYLGIEGGFYLNGNPSPTLSFGTTNTGIKSRNTFDISGRVGFVANQALIYGTGGFTSTKFETIGLPTKSDKRLEGIRYGGGIEFALTPQMSIRGEYTHANYQEWNVVSGATTINFDPSEHRFLLGASLRF